MNFKPSKMLIFTDGQTKVGNLGNSQSRTLWSPMDDGRIPGDPAFAPPEFLYRFTPTDWDERRVACDLYHLGSVTTFLFSRASMNALLVRHLDPNHHWDDWGSSYQDVLPYLIDAHSKALVGLKASLPQEERETLIEHIKYLTHPDPAQRGHPEERMAHGNRYSLQRFTSMFNRLASKAETKGRAAL